nr:immunoglobulin heavy chain junction region [Mus musculus]
CARGGNWDYFDYW